MPVDIVPASAKDERVLANLLELYAHDFSELTDVPLGADGRFGYPALPRYWLEPDRHAFLVYDEGLAGFVLVKRGSEISGDPAVWDVAEMFIVRGRRRRGTGGDVIKQVWRRLSGRWEVRVMEANRAALPFWERTITSFCGACSRTRSATCWKARMPSIVATSTPRTSGRARSCASTSGP